MRAVRAVTSTPTPTGAAILCPARLMATSPTPPAESPRRSRNDSGTCPSAATASRWSATPAVAAAAASAAASLIVPASLFATSAVASAAPEAGERTARDRSAPGQSPAPGAARRRLPRARPRYPSWRGARLSGITIAVVPSGRARHSPCKRQIDRLGATRGEHDLDRVASSTAADPLAGFLEQSAGILAGAVRGGGVADGHCGSQPGVTRFGAQEAWSPHDRDSAASFDSLAKAALPGRRPWNPVRPDMRPQHIAPSVYSCPRPET